MLLLSFKDQLIQANPFSNSHPVLYAVQVPEGEADVDEHDKEASGNLRNVGVDFLVDRVRKALGDHELHREVGRVVRRQKVAFRQQHLD